MPSSRRLHLTREAEEDLADIRQYTLETWGEEQEAAYAATLDRAFGELLTFPGIGRRRDDLAPGLRGYPVEQHVVFYLVDDDEITVIRILHRRRSAASQFGK